MSGNYSSNKNISTISELDGGHTDNILREPYKITKELFSPSKEFNLETFVLDVSQYIEANPLNKKTISNILGVFSYARPKKQELLKKIENAISITHSSMKTYFIDIFMKMSFIFLMDTTQLQLIEFIKNDSFDDLQQFISKEVNFNFEQSFHSAFSNVNLLDIAAYYGSIECFKYLVLNNAPFSEYVCPFSICGGNYEIIYYLENNFTEQNFDEELCLTMSIAYHQYEITDYLILNYNSKITNIKTAIELFNFPVFALYAMNQKLSIDELLIAANCNNLPIVQYLCEVAKVNTEATYNDGCTALHYASGNGHLPTVQYLCEKVKVNTEVKDNIGRTALHIACENGYLPIVQYLCETQKVNIESKDKDGRTAPYYGREHLPIIQYFESNGVECHNNNCLFI